MGDTDQDILHFCVNNSDEIIARNWTKELEALRAQLTERDREIERLKAHGIIDRDEQGRLREEIRVLTESKKFATDEACRFSSLYFESQAREREAVERAEKAEAEAAAWSGHYGEVGTENPEVMLAELQRLTPEDLAPIKGLFERKKRERERIAGLESALAAARKALKEIGDAARDVLIGTPKGESPRMMAPWVAGTAYAALERINGEGHAE